MRVRHLGPFPFRWSDSADTNPSDIEPITMTLSEAVALWWRYHKLLFTFSITATYQGDTRTFDNADLFEDFHAVRTRANNDNIDQDDELFLCYPGIDAAWDAVDADAARFTFNTNQSMATWGGSPGANGFGFTVEARFFTTAYYNALVKRRGTWTDYSTVKPATDILLTVTWFNNVDTNATATFTNIDYGTTSDTITADIFGESVTMYQLLDVGDYTGLVVDSASLTVAPVSWFEYDTYTGGAPVWNAATGAEILDPRTASVP